MEKLAWHLSTHDFFEMLGVLWKPLAIGFLLYHSNYLLVFARALLMRLGATGHARIAPHEAPDVLLVLPTLLRNRGELDGLQGAITSILGNGYPGRLIVCAAIDHAAQAPALCDELEVWARRHTRWPRAAIVVQRCDERGGKAMAIEHGIQRVRDMVRTGALPAMPPVFFNMDADSDLSDRALERMVFRLQKRSRVLGQRPMIVASNVCVRREHYWRGWRHFFTVPGQLSLQVAREYMTSISLARNNSRLLPVTSVSGALYCTWTDLMLQAPRFARYIQTLRFRDVLLWWLGRRPPRFEGVDHEPLPEAMTGPGDDTWIAWLAMGARWRRDRITLELPATPLHALLSLIRAYLVRPIGYDPLARVGTATPTRARALFKQRVRWNSSRVWLINRFGWSMWMSWSVGAFIYLDVLITLALHGIVVAGLLLWPLVDQPAQWLTLLIIANLAYLSVRALGTLLAMYQDGDVRGQWHKLLALPLSGPYHMVFNILPTIVGLVQDIFLSGVNTGFSPEHTLIRAGTGRIALAYRLRRAYGLAVRSLVRGDVPLGRFWLGWDETPWTPNGYRGWTDASARPPGLRERARDALARATSAKVREPHL